MEVVPLGSADEIAAVAAGIFEAVVRRKPAAVLGLATGSTPLPDLPGTDPPPRGRRRTLYAAVTCFNLDEYVGLPAGHAQSYRATIARELTDGLGVARSGSTGPDPAPTGCPPPGSATRR